MIWVERETFKRITESRQILCLVITTVLIIREKVADVMQYNVIQCYVIHCYAMPCCAMYYAVHSDLISLCCPSVSKKWLFCSQSVDSF